MGIAQFDTMLESDLYTSRVYSRTTHRHSMSSLLNSIGDLSFLSGISLAQILNLSVISLPIFCHELWNPQQYEEPTTQAKILLLGKWTGILLLTFLRYHY